MMNEHSFGGGPLMTASFKYGRTAFEFAEEVDRLPDPDEVANAMRRTMTQFGLETCGFFARIPSSQERLDRLVLTGPLPGTAEWQKIYSDEGYAEVDPLMRLLRGSGRPVEYREIPHDPSPRAVELMQRRRDFGFASGIAVRVFGPTSRSGLVTMTGPKPDLPACKKRALHLMTVYAFDRICALRSPQSAPKAVLTNRQQEVLTWVAVGKSAWETGKILRISSRTVEEHARLVLAKLGAVNRTQAVAIAIRDGLISI
jgi:LuxR family quorum sensing-dependent transcriptional regulator